MSRIPQRGTPVSTRTRTTSTTGPKLAAPSPRVRTKSAVGRRPASPVKPSKPAPEEPKAAPLSLREAIALKRAEAKKQQGSSRSPLDNVSTLQDDIPNAPAPEEEDILGRPPLREAIERAKSSGSLNISTRELVCLPRELFEIHLDIVPEPLKSVPEQPPLPPTPEPPLGKKRRGPAWYETQDLENLNAWGNEIAAIQPELALFGSLKAIDLHKNKLTSLPAEFGDFMVLATLDLSHNQLSALPTNLFSLPSLSNLNISNNCLTDLPFSSPFSQIRAKKSTTGGGNLFGPQIERAKVPLPKLAVLDASNNKFSAAGVDLNLPTNLFTLDLSGNALGDECLPKLFAALAILTKLKTLRFTKAGGVDDTLFAELPSAKAFPALTLLDFGETGVSEARARTALQSVLAQELSFDVTNDDPPAGTTRVIVGKKVVREAWELEAERRAKIRGKAVKEDEGIAFPEPLPKSTPASKPKAAPKPVVKEAWELEAEAGLLTEGGRRRARAAAAAKSTASDDELGLGQPPRQSSPTKTLTSVLSDPQYYNARAETLTLPPTTPPKSVGHGRAFSLALDRSAAPARASDVSLPTATLPLALIAPQPFAATLRVLVLQGRRVDRVFVLPSDPAVVLPLLEELNLEGCNLADTVAVSTSSDDTLNTVTTPPAGEQRPLLLLIAQLFPSLRSLNLAYNTLTSAALGDTEEILVGLVLSARRRLGLRSLILRGNRISSLDGFQDVALRFKSNRQVPEWTLEELDIRDNEIGKLPPEMGMLPLDVFLVDGNTFRVPARRVWEREGTKGLLNWLRGRME
uniref:Leucine-rich repeat-containing protein 40 n=1 Tax=Mycena chlorophos TaxID=658473 RepID=A0ABQ0MBW3_MYCCL|nr:predicted protein [Mycena chlorophos]